MSDEASNRVAALELTDLSLLEQLVKDPLRLYLEQTLGMSAWRDEDEPTPATIPLTVTKTQARALTGDLLHEIFGKDDAAAAVAVANWTDAKQSSGLLSLGPHMQRQVDEIIALARGLAAGLQSEAIDLRGLRSANLAEANQVGRFRISGTLPGIHAGTNQLAVVTASKVGRDEFGLPLHKAALHLLVAAPRAST